MERRCGKVLRLGRVSPVGVAIGDLRVGDSDTGRTLGGRTAIGVVVTVSDSPD